MCDIRKIIDEYGANNLRIFIEGQTRSVGFFSNPFFGNKEYVITDKDDVTKNHKITLQLVDKSYFDVRFYIADLNLMIERRLARVFVLVDEDNKYERIWP